MDALTGVSTRKIPQTKRADVRQEKNSAGGYVFQANDLAKLRRFLTLGVEGGTYYTNAGELAARNAAMVFAFAEHDPTTLVNEIVDVSVSGRAPRQNPAIFALAIASSRGDARGYALSKLAEVCRTGTHLFLFAKYIQQFRGWGRPLRNAVSSWYLSKSAPQVAFQAVKYRNREGFTHRDILRLAHPVTHDPAMRAVFDWICHETYGDEVPEVIEQFRRVNEPRADVPGILRSTRLLTWEMLPSDALSNPEVWDHLVGQGMPMTALMRNLPRLTNLGLLESRSGRTNEVVEQLTDAERLIRARVHPMNVLVAQRTYSSGKSVRGSSTWTPTRKIVDALDKAFYAAYGAVEPAGKRLMLALDVSGSMVNHIANLPLSCREASAAMALVQMATEPECDVVGFTTKWRTGEWWKPGNSGLSPLSISPRQRLDDAIRRVSDLPFGGTDCSLPMRVAMKERQEVDCFVIYTDNETWAGPEHAHRALVQYRQAMGIDARLIVVGMTATECSIADPADPLSLDVAGFDTSVPGLVSGFARGAL